MTAEKNEGLRLGKIYLSPSDQTVCRRMKLVQIGTRRNYVDLSRIEVVGSQDVVPYEAARGMNLERHSVLEDPPLDEPANRNDRSPQGEHCVP
jgi:hypothetical protein